MGTKKVWIIISILVLALAGAFAYVVIMRPTRTENTPAAPTQPNTQQPSEPAAKGTYTPYSESALSAAKGRKLLFFHAGWCPQCRSIEQGILRGTVPDGMTIFKVDYDSNVALKQKYGVTLQTTFVEVDENGEAIKKHVAYDNPTFDAVLKAFEQ
jgi:thiol-disulfide isomerase/thioredoxin